MLRPHPPRPLVCVIAAALSLLFGFVPAIAQPTPESSDEQQIRDAATAVLDTARSNPNAIDSIVILSEIERAFAVEMLKAMRAESAMGRRAAVAVGGSETSAPVRRVDEALASTTNAISSSVPVVEGETATLEFSIGPGPGATLHFKKSSDQCRFDFLRRYRERNQIDQVGIDVLKARQQAAELPAQVYEDKEETDLDALPTVYEAFKAQLLSQRVRAPATAPTRKD